MKLNNHNGLLLYMCDRIWVHDVRDCCLSCAMKPPLPQ